MRRDCLIVVLSFCLLLAAPVGQAGAAPPGPIVVDHTSVALYDQIPPEYFAAAEALTMFYTDRSVGANVDEALNCLAMPHAQAPNYCKRYIHRDPTYNTTPADVYWTGAHSRSNWQFVLCDGVDCTLAQYALTPVQAFGYFPSFLEAPQNADTFFVDHPSRQDIYDLAAFEAAHPETTMIYFTSSVSRSEIENTRWFNDQMRAWTAANGKVLFDFADIVGHTPQGQPCYDNRDGVAYQASASQYENYPDDGVNTPAICPQYTTEVDGGHLGSVSTAKVRVAKAIWVLMAQLAGWQPGSSGAPTPTGTPLPTATLLPTATATNTPMPTATPTNTPLPTATATNTPLPTATATNTSLPTATPTNTPLPTATPTDTPLPTATATNTPLPTATPTDTPLPTATATNTPLPAATPTNTPLPTATPTDAPLPTATPTDTPLPTATYTPTPQPAAVMHVGDLDGSTSIADATRWRANVRIAVHDAADAPVVGARIIGYWSSAAGSAVSCTTKTTGECVLANNNVSFTVPSLTFNVTDVTHAAYAYVAAANHDPDGDSDGVTIIILRP